MIPKNWKICQLDEVLLNTYSGGTPSRSIKEYYEKGTIPWIKSGELNKVYINSTEECITEKALKSSATKIVPKGTLLYALYGATAGIAGFTNIDAALNQAVLAVFPDEKILLKKYLFHFLFFEKSNIIGTYTQGGQPNLSASLFRELFIPIPPINEQYVIIDILDTIDRNMENISQSITLKEKKKKAITRDLLKGIIRFTEFKKSKRASIPLKDLIAEFIVPMRDKPKDLTGNIPWCRIEDFDGIYLEKSKSNQGVTKEVIKEMNLKLYPVNTVLVSCSAYLGICAIVKKPLVTNQTFIGLNPSDKIDPLFLYYYMIFSERELNLLSSGTTISYLSREEFENFEIELPINLEEQKKIASTLFEADAEINNLKMQLKKLKKQKKGLMQQLLTGKIKIKTK